MQYVPIFPHNFGFRPYSDGSSLAPPTGYAGLVGPAPGEGRITNGYNSAPRTYSGNWPVADGSFGGIRYAAYNQYFDGTQYYELPIFARVETKVLVEIIKATGNDGGTGDATVNGETKPFDAQGPTGEVLLVEFVIPAGEHVLKVRKLLRQSLYVRSVFLETA